VLCISLQPSIGKKKRKAKDDSNEPVTYINERNKVFNKKVARYFDKYTKEYVTFLRDIQISANQTRIRASFERGTAL
jgi:pre-mRNA-splicing factor SYF2